MAMVNAEIIYDYVEDIDPNLTCSICQSALVDPVTTTSCKHTFCRDCITTALTHQPQCPIDRSALTIHSLQDTEMLVKLMLDELKVKCAAEECGEIMQRGLLLGHSRGCQKVVVGCGNADCGLTMKREKLAHHRAYECFQRQMECHTCQTRLTFKHRLQHSVDGCDSHEDTCPHCNEILPMSNRPRLHAWTCAKAPVPCTHTSRGCPSIVPRESLSAHLQTCPFESLASFFEVNDARYKAFEDRANTLEGAVRGLQIELAATKADLANARHTLAYLRGRVRDTWVQRGPPSNLPFSEDDPIFADFFPPPSSSLGISAPATLTPVPLPDRGVEDPTTPQNAPRELTSIATPRGSAERPIRPSLSPPAEILAPSAPALATSAGSPRSPPRSVASPAETAAIRPGITDRAAADIHAAQTQPSGFASQNLLSSDGNEARESYADEVFERLPVGMPPDRAITSLMRITARLALGMDRIERRSQTRTMTESLRVQEEVASLRGIVNTMRMRQPIHV